MDIKKITDKEFLQYGRVLDDYYDFTSMMEKMEKYDIPDGVTYVPSVEELEMGREAINLKMRMFGEMPIQIGYCIGKNTKLNALEYHRTSEIDVAITDMILLLGKQQDIEDFFHYDTSKVEAFFVPAGTGVELFATTLHYAPCNAGTDADGFKCVVVLPQGTNTDLMSCHSKTYDDKLLFAKNKWLLAHEDAKIEGAFVGLTGENIDLADN
jgi:hypothetical protein